MSFTTDANVTSFIDRVKELLKTHENAHSNPSYEGMKIKLQTSNNIAKIINKEFNRELINNMPGNCYRLLSVMYLKMRELIDSSKTAHIRDYLTNDKEILKIKKRAFRLQKNAKKAINILFNLMKNLNPSIVPNYDLILTKHKNLESGYWLRPRRAVNYVEEDSNCDDPCDEDYKPYVHVSKTVVINSNSRPKRNIPVVDYTGMDTIEPESKFDGMTDIWYDESIHFDSDYEFQEDDDEDDELDSCVDEEENEDYEDVDDVADEQFVSDYHTDPDYIPNEDSNDDDSEYSPSDDEEFEDDHVLEFCDDDYAEETEEDDDDYEDEDESNQEDNEFLSDYYNDPDYKTNKNIVLEDDDSEYSPNENDELDDDHVLEFDDDDYAEESEEDDDDYEDDSEDEEDVQFVSDYHNDPDYNPDEDIESEDELEYDFSFKNKKIDENGDIILKGGVVDDDDDEYIPEDDEDDEDEYVMYSYKKDNLITVCKRMYDRNTGKVRFNWIKMTENDYAKKYDEEYVCEEN